LPHPSALPFAGLRVVDMSDRLAGSYFTKLLVDAGGPDSTHKHTQPGKLLRRDFMTEITANPPI
jgi:hypothetical protein